MLRRILPVLLVGLALGAPLAASLRLVPIGDSITQGRGSSGGKIPTYSWRYPLWKMLVDAEVDADFVGSLSVGFGSSPDWAPYKGVPFDRDHEGHWGWKTNAVRDQLAGWLGGYTPDIAFLLLGTNDPGDYAANLPNRNQVIAAETAEEQRQIIELLRADNPGVTVFVGGPFQEWDPFPALRTALQAMAAAASTAQSPVIYVDHSPGWVSRPDATGTDTVDWVHPNPQGDAKIAARWFAALAPHLPQTYGLVKYRELPDDFATPEAGDAADFDGDTLVNLLEYALGGRLAVADGPDLLPTVSLRGTRAVYRFHRDLGRVSVRYVVEGSTNLVDWDEVLYDSATDPGTDGGAGEIEVMRDVAGEAAYHVRLRVERTDAAPLGPAAPPAGR